MRGMITPYKTAAEIRRENLVRVINAHFGGVAARLAEKLGVPLPQIARLTSDAASRRNIGDSLARDIEQAVGLDRGWMDAPHDGGDDVYERFKSLSAKDRETIKTLIDSFLR